MIEPIADEPKGHPIRAILAGAVTGIAIFGALMTWNLLTWDQDQPTWPWGGLYLVALATGLCMLFLAAGAVVALPAWAWLRSWGCGDWWEAGLIGFVSAGGVVFTYFNFFGGPLGVAALPASALVGAIGAICWTAGWRAGRA